MSEISNAAASYRVQRADELRAGGAYRLDDTIPPVGTRVVHEGYGPGEIVDHGQQPDLGQWFVRFDQPFRDDGGPFREVWVYPYTLRPEVQQDGAAERYECPGCGRTHGHAYWCSTPNFQQVAEQPARPEVQS